MAISIVKAIEILHLNSQLAASRIPPDVKDSVFLAMDALFLIQDLRLGNKACVFAPLQHEEGYNAPTFEQDHNHPGMEEPAP